MGFWGAIESLKNEGWKENKGKEQKLEYYQNEARIFNDRELVQMYKVTREQYKKTHHEEDKWCAYGYRNELKKRGILSRD